MMNLSMEKQPLHPNNHPFNSQDLLLISNIKVQTPNETNPEEVFQSHLRCLVNTAG